MWIFQKNVNSSKQQPSRLAGQDNEVGGDFSQQPATLTTLPFLLVIHVCTVHEIHLTEKQDFLTPFLKLFRTLKCDWKVKL